MNDPPTPKFPKDQTSICVRPSPPPFNQPPAHHRKRRFRSLRNRENFDSKTRESSAHIFRGRFDHESNFTCAVTTILTHHLRDATVNGQASFLSRLSADRPLRLALVVPIRDPTALEQFAKDLYDPSSAPYRQYLTVAPLPQNTPAADESAPPVPCAVPYARCAFPLYRQACAHPHQGLTQHPGGNIEGRA